MSSSVSPDIDQQFDEYLARVQDAIGEAEFGQFIKHDGKLVKKLRKDEFEEVYGEYFDLAKQYFASIDRGDTINDVVVRLLRQRAAELFLTSPV